ncbi:MAG: hypothetical protein EOP62_03035 [Sphingomonadales bacterium]|nr:MAG: hypothetical protein EOP62_03035 [Sphingomonadales bacterium]
MLKSAVLALLFVAAPAHADDWYYVDASDDLSNISFIDKDSIKPNAAGNLLGAMYSVLSEEEDGVVAYRFLLEVDCKANKSRLTAAELFDAKMVSDGVSDMAGEWETVAAGTQGGAISGFICAKGVGNQPSVGSALPFAKGRAMLTEMRTKGSTK